MNLTHNKDKHNIQLLTIIGEIEGHEAVAGNTKATKYEHLLPMLAEVEDNEEIEGLLILLNTHGRGCGGRTVDCRDDRIFEQAHSVPGTWRQSLIGGPFAVSANYSFIVPSGTMIIHPVRSNGMFIGVEQSLSQYDQNPGSDHKVPFPALPYDPGENRRTDAQSYGTGERRRDASGGRGSCKRRD